MTVREEVQKRYDKLLETRRNDLAIIDEKVKEARAKKAAAEQKIKEATTALDIAAYEKAKAAAQVQANVIGMYEGRQKQLANQELVTQADGDETIDRLLAYEREISAKYEADIVEPLQALKDLYTAYTEEVRRTELMITLWTRNIKQNYRSFGTSWYNVNGELKDISPKPIPVHTLEYRGCDASQTIGKFLTGPAQGLF